MNHLDHYSDSEQASRLPNSLMPSWETSRCLRLWCDAVGDQHPDSRTPRGERLGQIPSRLLRYAACVYGRILQRIWTIGRKSIIVVKSWLMTSRNVRASPPPAAWPAWAFFFLSFLGLDRVGCALFCGMLIRSELRIEWFNSWYMRDPLVIYTRFIRSLRGSYAFHSWFSVFPPWS